MIVVDAINECLSGFLQIEQRDPNELGIDRMPWQCVIGREHGHRVIAARNPAIYRRVHAIDEQPLVAEAMQELERPIRRFRNAVKGEEAKASMKRERRKIVLFEN